MAIGTPGVVVGPSAGNANSGSANATTTTAAAGVGALVFIRVGNATLNSNITAFSDSASNHWTIVQSNTDPDSANSALCWSILTNFLPIGASFTASTSDGGQWNFDGGWKVNGCNGGADVSVVGLTGANTTGISQGTGTLATTAGEIIIGSTNTAGGITYTESANFTNLWGAGSGNGGIGYRIVSGNGSITWAPTWTTASDLVNWQLLSFKISAVGQADGVGAAPGIGLAGSIVPGTGVATGTGTAPAFALASGTGATSILTGVAVAFGAAEADVVALASGTGTAVAISVNAGVGVAAGIGTALAISGLQGIANGLAVGIGAAPGIGLGGISRKTGAVGWFDEWDLPPPPIRRQRLMAIQRVQRNNGWLNAGRIFKSLGRSTKRMRRDQNFRYEDDEEELHG